MKLIVKMRLFKGKETYDKSGNVSSVNQFYKIPYGGVEWENWKKTVKYSFTRAEVVEVFEEHTEDKIKKHAGKDHPYLEYSYKDVEDIEKYKAEVEAVFAAPEVELTPEQKEIKELKAQMAALLEGKKPAKKAKVLTEADSEADLKGKPRPDNPSEDEDFEARKLEATRKEYQEILGKKPHHKLSIEKMNEAIKSGKS